MSSTEAVRVTIFNQTYTVLATEGSNDVQELAHVVDELMSTISRSGNYDSTRTAVMACLHLADQLRSAERQMESLKLEVDSKAREFSLKLESVIDE
jgi:cell division protein ZapA